MKAMLRTVKSDNVTYDALMFVCPGCVAGGPPGYEGVHMLPVNAQDLEIGKPWWEFDGDLEKPTLSPSILSDGHVRCHSYLKEGIFEFLNDCTHPLVGQKVPMVDLPDWAAELSHEDDL